MKTDRIQGIIIRHQPAGTRVGGSGSAIKQHVIQTAKRLYMEHASPSKRIAAIRSGAEAEANDMLAEDLAERLGLI